MLLRDAVVNRDLLKIDRVKRYRLRLGQTRCGAEEIDQVAIAALRAFAPVCLPIITGIAIMSLLWPTVSTDLLTYWQLTTDIWRMKCPNP